MAWGRPRWLVAAGGLAAVIALAALALALQAQSDRAAPAMAAPQGSAGRFALVSAPLDEKRAGIMLIDSQTMRLLVYALDPDTRLLRLLAVRDISQDVRLAHYNNERPWPEDIRQRVEAGENAGQK